MVPQGPSAAPDSHGDLYGASPESEVEARRKQKGHGSPNDSLFVSNSGGDEAPELDELDALLAEEAANEVKDPEIINTNHRNQDDDEFADEMEVMAELGI